MAGLLDPPLSENQNVTPIYIGIDAGTSGIRACAINSSGNILASCARTLPLPEHLDNGGIQQDPQLWSNTVHEIIRQLGKEVNLALVAAIAVDGTSGTVLLLDEASEPVTAALMYNDARAIRQLQVLHQLAPKNAAVHAVTAGLPKLMWLAEHTPTDKIRYIAHQADWLCQLFTGQPGHSDINNCLKSGFDPVNQQWPDWIAQTGLAKEWLPTVHKPGERIGQITTQVAKDTGLNENAIVVAGTTDSHAAILATGIGKVGDAVTSLGSTLVTKVISDKPLFNSDYGIYSQPFGDHWLVGGASNSGGAVLRNYFTDEKMQALTALIDPTRSTGLDYYPLPAPGERFPLNDPHMQPRLSPRPDNEAEFFQGMLEGMARIEHEAYSLLHKLGAPYPKTLRTVGGGAVNKKWTQIRAKYLDVDMLEAIQTEAAYGSALLARGKLK